jgi:hypothetical protein
VGTKNVKKNEALDTAAAEGETKHHRVLWNENKKQFSYRMFPDRICFCVPTKSTPHVEKNHKNFCLPSLIHNSRKQCGFSQASKWMTFAV